MSLRSVRALQLLGILIAVVGLSGFWLSRDVQRTLLSEAEREVLGVEEGEFQASFVIAGRDLDYVRAASPCRWVAGRCVRDRPGEAVYGNRTDTVIFVNIVGQQVSMVNFPRDLYIESLRIPINEVYYYRGAEGLKRAVSEVLNLPVDYYAVINIDLFKNLVDAIGGVDVNVPHRMYYVDQAAGLTIDLHPGPQRLSGKQASDFVRYRQTVRGDYDRIDRVKTLAYAMVDRLRELNVRAVTTLPSLINTFFDDVETNASPAVLLQLLPRLGQLNMHAATIPTNTPEGARFETYSASQVEAFVAAMLGTRARELAEVPEVPLLITNRSGVPGLAEDVKVRLISMGIDEALLVTREETTTDPAPTRLVTTSSHWQDASYYASLFHIGQQQVDRLNAVDGVRVGLELILAENASGYASRQRLASAP